MTVLCTYTHVLFIYMCMGMCICMTIKHFFLPRFSVVGSPKIKNFLSSFLIIQEQIDGQILKKL